MTVSMSMMICVFVRKDAIIRVFDSIEEYKKYTGMSLENKDSIWEDDDLIEHVFMGPLETEEFCKELTDKGLILDKDDKFIDIAIAEMGGTTLPCDWLYLDEDELVWSFVKQTEREK